MAPAVAQEKPDFSGKWTMDPTRSESVAQAADASPHGPVTVAITQTPDEVVIVTDRDGPRERVTYRFDRNGSSAPKPIGTTGSDTRVIEDAQARWDGARLVTTTIYRVNGMATKTIETRSLAENTREMIVETQLQVEHGYESNGRGPQGYTVVKDVYKK
jgi:hypothetical protein